MRQSCSSRTMYAPWQKLSHTGLGSGRPHDAWRKLLSSAADSLGAEHLKELAFAPGACANCSDNVLHTVL